MLVQGADACLVAIIRAEANSRALTYGRVIMASGLYVGDDASSPLGGVTAGTDHPLGHPGIGPCRFDVLGGLMSPRG